MDKNLWFSPDEYSDQILKLQQALNKRGLHAFLGFQAESVTWLTGYYTRAYGAFRFVIVPTQCGPTIVSGPIAFYVKARSLFECCISWSDGDDQIGTALSVIADCEWL